MAKWTTESLLEVQKFPRDLLPLLLSAVKLMDARGSELPYYHWIRLQTECEFVEVPVDKRIPGHLTRIRPRAVFKVNGVQYRIGWSHAASVGAIWPATRLLARSTDVKSQGADA